jgi:predicted Zn-dependent protease
MNKSLNMTRALAAIRVAAQDPGKAEVEFTSIMNDAQIDGDIECVILCKHQLYFVSLFHGDSARALDLLAQLINEAPSAGYFLLLGRHMEAQGDVSEALSAYEKARTFAGALDRVKLQATLAIARISGSTP